MGAEETVPPSERGRQLEGFPAHLDPYSGPGLLNAGKASRFLIFLIFSRTLLQMHAVRTRMWRFLTKKTPGKACWGHCDSTAGPCAYCGTGACCRQQDYDHGVPGCELAHEVQGLCEIFLGVFYCERKK